MADDSSWGLVEHNARSMSTFFRSKDGVRLPLSDTFTYAKYG